MTDASLRSATESPIVDPVDPHRYQEIDTIRGLIIVAVMLGSFGLRYQNMVGHLGPAPIFGYAHPPIAESEVGEDG